MGLNAENIRAIKEYKYNGGDSSLVYQYVLSPFAQMLVNNFVPLSVAPNVITLSGLLLTLVCSILHIILNPDLKDCPPWLCLFSGFCIFGYQTLDNMDGKQARRTGSSSALGNIYLISIFSLSD